MEGKLRCTVSVAALGGLALMAGVVDVHAGCIHCCVRWAVQEWNNITGCVIASKTSIFPGRTRNLWQTVDCWIGNIINAIELRKHLGKEWLLEISYFSPHFYFILLILCFRLLFFLASNFHKSWLEEVYKIYKIILECILVEFWINRNFHKKYFEIFFPQDTFKKILNTKTNRIYDLSYFIDLMDTSFTQEAFCGLKTGSAGCAGLRSQDSAKSLWLS